MKYLTLTLLTITFFAALCTSAICIPRWQGPLDLGEDIVQISTDSQSIAALTKDGRICHWGYCPPTPDFSRGVKSIAVGYTDVSAESGIAVILNSGKVIVPKGHRFSDQLNAIEEAADLHSLYDTDIYCIRTNDGGLYGTHFNSSGKVEWFQEPEADCIKLLSSERAFFYLNTHKQLIKMESGESTILHNGCIDFDVFPYGWSVNYCALLEGNTIAIRSNRSTTSRYEKDPRVNLSFRSDLPLLKDDEASAVLASSDGVFVQSRSNVQFFLEVGDDDDKRNWDTVGDQSIGRIRQIVISGLTTFFLTEKGRIWASGKDEAGRAVVSKDLLKPLWIKAPARSWRTKLVNAEGGIFVKRSDGKLVGFGKNWVPIDTDTVCIPLDIGEIQDGAVSPKTGMAIDSQGAIRAWGWSWHLDEVPPLKKNDLLEIPLAIRNRGPFSCIGIGEGFAAAATRNGEIVFWGELTEHDKFVRPNISSVESVSISEEAGIVLNKDGEGKVFGLNPPIPPFELKNIRSVSAGIGHFLVLIESGIDV